MSVSDLPPESINDKSGRWRELRQWIIDNDISLPPGFWNPPRNELERVAKTAALHALCDAMYAKPADSCDCDDCIWIRSSRVKS